MRDYLNFYIDGAWVEPVRSQPMDVINPANEAVAGRISLGSADDVDKAVAAARRAFISYSLTSRAERIELLKNIISEFERRYADIAAAITEEMGAPSWLAKQAQAGSGIAHLRTGIETLSNFQFDEVRGGTLITHEPIGVCAMITPWNWPINQIACKVVPALATGCTMVLKPSEIAPFSAYLWTEILHAAGVPAGVFNLVNGVGQTVGVALSSHPDIDMVSFTGSTRAGIEVARNAAPTVKRVAQELGGKSPNIILEEADLEAAVTSGVLQMMNNSGQSCNAPSRMLIPAAHMDEAKTIAKTAAEGVTVGSPNGNCKIGPVISKAQWDKIQWLIQSGIDEGATLIAGGGGKPEGLETGYYVKPTVFADVSPNMTIAREEIFGPVLTMMAYEDEDQAIAIANDTVYGLAAYVQGDPEHAKEVARKLRAGRVHLNGSGGDMSAPFGGYKQSGNGREWGDYGFREFLETKAVLGWEQAQAAK
jgi:aldehyde dehydrogenase (NAD+)